MTDSKARSRLAVLAGAVLVAGQTAFAARVPPAASEQAREILETTGVTGGFVVVVGCGDGGLAAGLRAGEGFLVQALDADAASVEAARRNIQALGLYGPVTVERFDGRSLPYVDNLARLLVAEDLGDIPADEILRVLAPLGVAYLKQHARWRKVVKPWPEEIDEWTHHLYDASNNAVAHDSVVGPLKGVQWTAGPLYSRSHEHDSSVSAVVSAGGRMIYILDEGPIGVADKRLPMKWSLYARDAFSGVFLWKIPLPDWGWTEWKKYDLAGADWTTRASERLRSPVTLGCRLVAEAESVYVTLGYRAGISILDAATGAVIRELAGTENTDEILVSDGVVLAVVRRDLPPIGKGKAGKAGGKAGPDGKPIRTDVIVAFEAATGRQL